MKNEKRRRKGAGSISKLASGKYRGRLTVEGNVYSCVGNTETEVRKKLELQRKKIMKDEIIPERIFVGKFIEKWLIEVKKPALKSSSYDRLERTYENHIRKNRIARCQLGNVTAMDVQLLINEVTSKLSYSSIKKVYELLNACFEYAVASRQMVYNPVKAVQMPKEENLAKRTKKMPVFLMEELEKIEALAKSDDEEIVSRLRYVYFFIFLANTGLRIGEALALSWENVDFEKNRIYITKNMSRIKERSPEAERKTTVILTSVKTKQGNRTIPCNAKAVAALHWLKKYQQERSIVSKFVICNDSGDFMSQSNIPRNLQIILKMAHVEYKNVHAFRHSFATNLINAGVDIKTVSVLMGHASVKVTMDTYVHENLDRAIDAVGRLSTTK